MASNGRGAAERVADQKAGGLNRKYPGRKETSVQLLGLAISGGDSRGSKDCGRLKKKKIEVCVGRKVIVP